MKKLQLVLLLAMSMIMLCSCGKDEENPEGEPTDSDISVNESVEVSDESADETASDIVVTDEEGNIVSVDESDLPQIVTDENGSVISVDTESTEEIIDTTKELPVIDMKKLADDDRYKVYIPHFSYSVQSKSIDKINTGLASFEKALEILKKRQDKNSTVDCRSFCFSNYKYVTAVVYWKEIPDNMTDGSVYSYVFDVQNEKLYSLNKALSNHDLKQSELESKFKAWYKNDEKNVKSVKTDAFRISSSDMLEIYLTAKFDDGTSEVYVYNHTAEAFTRFDPDVLESAEVFEEYTALADYSVDSSKKYTIKDTEFTEAELIATANEEYMKAYCLTSYLFGGKGEYGTAEKVINGAKYYKSEQEGLKTYDEAVLALSDMFLFPQEFFGEKIETCMYRDDDGSLWIRETDKDARECTATGVTGVDSIRESIAVFKVSSEFDGMKYPDYFSLIYSNGKFKCTNFTYPE